MNPTLKAVAGSDVPDSPSSEFSRLAPKDAAVEVEGLFTSLIVSEMRKTLSDGSFFGSGPGTDIFNGMFEQLMGRELARQGGFGLQTMVQRDIDIRTRAAEAAAATAAGGVGPIATPPPMNGAHSGTKTGGPGTATKAADRHRHSSQSPIGGALS